MNNRLSKNTVVSVRLNQPIVNYIVSNTTDEEVQLGDFIIRSDFGINAYYKGAGGKVKIPEEIDNEHIHLQLNSSVNITE